MFLALTVCICFSFSRTISVLVLLQEEFKKGNFQIAEAKKRKPSVKRKREQDERNDSAVETKKCRRDSPSESSIVVSILTVYDLFN